jgi:uncharacterized membrane protein
MWLAFLIQLAVFFIAVVHAIWDRQRIRLNVFRGNWGWLLCSLGFLSMTVRRGTALYYSSGTSIDAATFNLINSVIFLTAVIAIVLSEKSQYEDIVLMMDKCQKKAEYINNRLEKA